MAHSDTSIRPLIMKAPGIAVAVLASLAFATTAAFAASQSSNVSAMGNYGGYSFRNQATITDDGAGAGGGSVFQSETRTYVTSGQVPANWLGAEARMFRDNGVLCGTSGMDFAGNTRSFTNAFNRGSSSNCGGAGHDYFYSYGKAGRWDGNGYDYQYTFRSPNLYD